MFKLIKTGKEYQKEYVISEDRMWEGGNEGEKGKRGRGQVLGRPRTSDHWSLFPPMEMKVLLAPRGNMVELRPKWFS